MISCQSDETIGLVMKRYYKTIEYFSSFWDLTDEILLSNEKKNQKQNFLRIKEERKRRIVIKINNK